MKRETLPFPGRNAVTVRILFAFLFGWFSWTFPSEAQSLPQYRWRNFTTRDGLVSNHVQAILEDAAGNVWIATGAGVSRFDGLWTNFTEKQGLPDVQVNTLVSTHDGRVGAGTGQGIAFYDGSAWRPLEIPDPLQIGRDVRALAETAPGVLWVGTTRGAARYDGSRWVRLPIPDPLQQRGVTALLAEPQGDLWVGFSYPGGLMHFLASQGRWEILDPGARIPEGTVHVLLLTPSGDLWVGAEGGLARYRDGRWELMHSGGVQDAAWDSDGAIWFATSTGLLRYREDAWYPLGTMEGLAAEDATSVWVDRHGRLWVGTRDRGISFTDRAWQTWRTNQELPLSDARVLYQDAQGTLWCGGSQGLARLQGETWQPVFLPSGREIRAMTLDASRNLWVATERGLAVFDGFGWIYHTQEDGLGSDDVYALMMDSSGRIWAGHAATGRPGSHDGFSWYDGLQWKHVPTNSPVVAFLEDQAGHFWIATARDGLKYIPGGAVQDITVGDGLISNQITALAQTPDGQVWVGTRAGLSVYDGQGWHAITREQGLSDNQIRSLAVLSTGELWVGTQDGISIFDGVRWSTLTVEDGLPGNPVDAIYETLEGDLWVASASAGVSLYRPERLAPRVRIISGPRGIIGVRAVSFVFEGGDASTPRDELLYSYRLGIQDWSPFTPQTFASFTNLSDGTYTFFVRAQDRARNISRPAQVSFTVDATEPVVILRRPVEGEVLGGVYDILGTATDVTDFLEYQVEAGPEFIFTSQTPVADGVLASWDTRSLIDGKYSVRLSAWDRVDGPHDVSHVRSVTVGVVVDNTPPVVEFLKPEAGATYQGQVAIESSMVDLHLSEFVLKASQKRPNGGVITRIIQTGRLTGQSVRLPLVWDSSGLDGPIQLILEAQDQAGNRTTAQVAIRLDNAGARPEVRFESPTGGSVLAGLVEIRGTASDPQLQHFEIRYRAEGEVAWHRIAVGNQSVQSARLALWDTTPLPDGPYQLQLTAEDQNGYQATSLLSVVLDNTPPQIHITAPPANQVVATASHFEIQGTISDANLQDYRMEFAFATTPDQWSEITSASQPPAPGLLGIWNTRGLDGEILLRLTARDRAFPNPNVAQVVHPFVLDDTPPQIAILDPAPQQIVTGIVTVRGTIQDAHLDRYALSVQVPKGSVHPLPVFDPHRPQINAPLAQWDTQGLEGPVELRVEVWDQAGRQYVRTQEVIVDNRPPVVAWLTPDEGAQVRGSVMLLGTATDANFAQYMVEYQVLEETPGQPIPGSGGWRPITEAPVAQPVEGGLLATWHTQDQPGRYRVRVTAVDQVGHERIAVRDFVIPDPVSPEAGGQVQANDARVRVIIPPHALRRATTFTINPAGDGVATASPEGSPIYLVEPALTFPSAKPAILEMQWPNARDTWKIFQWDDDAGRWRFLGGTPSGDRIRAPILRTGRFQLREAGTIPALREELSRLRCQPRQFSPRRGERLAISFFLGREMPVDVFIFNGAGRLQRKVLDAALLAPGGNVVWWDGKDRHHQFVPTGPYLVVVQAGEQRLQQGVVVWNQ